VYFHCDSYIDEHHYSSSLGEATYRRGLPGTHVHGFGANCAVSKSVREEQLSEHKMGPLPHEG